MPDPITRTDEQLAALARLFPGGMAAEVVRAHDGAGDVFAVVEMAREAMGGEGGGG